MLKRSQATLVGGIILLTILVGLVLPLILQLTRAATSIGESVRLAAEVKSRALKEKVTLTFVFNETAAVLYVNNSGTVRVVIEKIIILNRTSGEPLKGAEVCGSPDVICGVINVGYASRNPLVANAPPAYDDCRVGILRHGSAENLECLDDTGKAAVLDPGDVLYVSLDPALLPLINNTVAYAESAYGVIHPIVSPPAAPGQGGAGLPIPPSAIPRGLYTPITGYILWGFKEINDTVYTEVIHPPFRVSTLGPNPAFIKYIEGEWSREQREYCGGIPYKVLNYVFNVRRYLGTYNITFMVSQSSYLYIYTSSGWKALLLKPRHVYTIYGYVGAIGILSPKYSSILRIVASDCPYGDRPLLILDGWAQGVIIDNARDIRDLGYIPPQLNYPSTLQELYKSGIIVDADYDDNGINEYGIRTFKYSGVWDALDADGSGTNMYSEVDTDYAYSDDAIAYRITILRDITGVNAIQVSFKALVDYDLLSTGFTPNPQAYIVRPVIIVALLKLDKTNYRWVIAGYKVVNFDQTNSVVWVNVMFPANLTDVYRISIFVYDPYGLINIGTNYVHGWCKKSSLFFGCTSYYDFMGTLETHVHIEHIIVQYYVYNPLLRKIPVVYIVNITGVPYWPNNTATSFGTFGQVNLTELQSYWSSLENLLQRLSVYPIVVSNWNEFRVLLGDRDAPVNPVVIFLHGPIIPVDSKGVRLYDPVQEQYLDVTTPEQFVIWLSHMIKARGWIVVFPYGPPLGFAWDTATDNYYNNDPSAYISGGLLSTLLHELLGINGVSASYVLTRYKYAVGAALDNYTVGRTDLGWQAMRSLRIWLLPRTMYGNYSIYSDQLNDPNSPLYAAFAGHIFYVNTTLPDGSSGLAIGAGYVQAGRGAAVFIAAPRPGVIDPRRLAAMTVDLGVYVWKLLVGG